LKTTEPILLAKLLKKWQSVQCIWRRYRWRKACFENLPNEKRCFTAKYTKHFENTALPPSFTYSWKILLNHVFVILQEWQ